MDNFALIFIVVTALGLLAFWKIGRFVFKMVKNAQPEKDSSAKFNDGETKLAGQFDDIVKSLEKERQVLYTRTKGLFKRAFFRTWFFLTCGLMLLIAILSPSENLEVAIVIGPIVMSAFVALIGGGIYTLVKKNTNSYDFSRKLKKQLVSKIVTFVNPELSFSGIAIDKEDFNQANLFPGSVFTSEDTIQGTIEGEEVSISECEQRNTAVNSRSEKRITYFDGLFIILQLKNINLSAPLKIIPTYNVEKNTIKLGESSLKIGNPNMILIKDKDEITLDVSDKFKAFCENKAEAKAIMNDKFLKVADFILGKYEYKDVFISINKNKLYLALSWNQDMFETDAFLKKSLLESKIAEKVHQDILFINQAIKEVNLINKLNG